MATFLLDCTWGQLTSAPSSYSLRPATQQIWECRLPQVVPPPRSPACPSRRTLHQLLPCCSVAKSCPTLRPHGRQHSRLPCPSPSRSLLKLMSSESVMPANHLILCRALLLLPSTCPSIRVFSNELALLIRWPKYWSFSFSISPSNEYSGLISFRINQFDLLAVQGRVFSHSAI